MKQRLTVAVASVCVTSETEMCPRVRESALRLGQTGVRRKVEESRDAMERVGCAKRYRPGGPDRDADVVKTSAVDGDEGGCECGERWQDLIGAGVRMQ